MAQPLRPYFGSPEALDHLGFGVVRPFRRDGRADVATASGAALVKACIVQVLGTIGTAGSRVGELPWRTEFGSALSILRHANADDEATQQLARVYVAQALQRWEPRCRVTDVKVSVEERSAGVALRIEVFFDLVESESVVTPNLSQVVQVPVQ